MSKIYVIKDPYAIEGQKFRFVSIKESFLQCMEVAIKENYFVNLDLGYIDTDDHDLEIHPIDKETLRVIL
jgi:hypothetical protein